MDATLAKSTMRKRSVKELRELAATRGISLHGLVEKDEIVQLLAADMVVVPHADMVVGTHAGSCNMPSSNMGSMASSSITPCGMESRASSYGSYSPGGMGMGSMASSSSGPIVMGNMPPYPSEMPGGMPSGSSQANTWATWSPPEASHASQEIDKEKTEQVNKGIIAKVKENMNNKVPRTTLLNVWHDIPDEAGGYGKWCFIEPGTDIIYGPSLFYPLLRKNNLALAFTNPRWQLDAVRLEACFVLCWDPAGYIWPYCMLCSKFCFPYDGEYCHRHTIKHLQRLQDWRYSGDDATIAWAMQRNHCYKFMRLT